MTMKTGWAALAGALAMAFAAWAIAADPVGVLTEIRAEKGRVEVKKAGEADWKVAQPLLALRPGDQIRVSGEARASLVFTGGAARRPSRRPTRPSRCRCPRPPVRATRPRRSRAA